MIIMNRIENIPPDQADQNSKFGGILRGGQDCTVDCGNIHMFALNLDYNHKTTFVFS